MQQKLGGIPYLNFAEHSFALQVDVDENAELDEENAEGKLRFSGGHGEAATYDDGDDEDRRIRAAAAKADDALDDEVRPKVVAVTHITVHF